MRADAARNLEAVLRTGARLLAEDPSTSITAIAAAAGVDRRTVHRRFATREALLSAVFEAKLDASERVLDGSRLTEAPVAIALHHYVEGIIPVSRQWPVDTRRLLIAHPTASVRREELSHRLDVFMDRAHDEGLLRTGTPPGWARAVLDDLVDGAAHRFTDLEPPQAADLVVATLLSGLGAQASRS